VVAIGNSKVDWHRIRAEYASGGISQRKLAEKHGIPWSTLQKKAAREHWGKDREKACAKVVERAVRKTAEKAADNATIAADIKRKGLLLLSRLFDEYAEVTSTEHRDYDAAGKNLTDIKRLRDLTAAYRDLTGDMVNSESKDSELLQSLFEMERKHNG
jgi:transposase-like protein